MVSDPDTREPLSRAEIRRLGSLIAERGAITGTSGRYGQVLKLRPPLTFSREQADILIAAIDGALRELRR